MQARCAGRRRWVGPGSRGGVARSGKGFRRALAPGRARVRWLHSELTTAQGESMSGAQRGKSRVCVQISVVKVRPSIGGLMGDDLFRVAMNSRPEGKSDPLYSSECLCAGGRGCGPGALIDRLSSPINARKLAKNGSPRTEGVTALRL